MNATITPGASLEKSFAKQQATVATLDAAYNKHAATIAATGNALLVAGVDTQNLDYTQRDVAQSLTEAKTAASELQTGMKGARGD